MTQLRGRVVEMVTQRRSTKAVSDVLMGRWFWVRGGEIGAGMGAVDNGGALVTPFIGSLGSGRWAVKGREATAVELQ
jgi:hypothetical protein